jgi:hypothetical protein
MSKEKRARNSGKRKQEKGSAPKRDLQLAVDGELHQIAGAGHPALTTNQVVASGMAVDDTGGPLKVPGPVPVSR